MAAIHVDEEAMTRFIPNKPMMRFDIMIGDRYFNMMTFPCEVGKEYTSKDLKAYARKRYPSLTNKYFEVKLSGKPIFRN